MRTDGPWASLLQDLLNSAGLDMPCRTLPEWQALYNSLLSPTPVRFRDYFQERTAKQMIVWHHTAGAGMPDAVYAWWAKDPQAKVATPVVIDRKGVLAKGFDEDFWGHHLGTRWSNNTALNRASVAVELVNWGWAHQEPDGRFLNYTGGAWKGDAPVQMQFRSAPYRLKSGKTLQAGQWWEPYSNSQMSALLRWTGLIAIRYGIPLTSSYRQMWTVNDMAKQGQPGLYSHCSFREDKWDVAPTPELQAAFNFIIRHF